MTPIDLSRCAPRSPHDALDGLVFLPRSIDKARAMLPGGNPGAYVMAGLTHTMLDMLGIPHDAFVEAVARAASEDEVAAFVRERAAPEKCDEWNAFIAVRQPRGGNRAEALTVFPWLADRPDLSLALDILVEDDRRHFATGA